jgi:2-keto-4-pentenoate hydratase
MPIPETPYPTDKLSQELDAISERLVAARLSATALQEFPGQLPVALDDAYAVQSASIARWPDDVVGWKVGLVPAEDRIRLHTNRLAGPIFRNSIYSIDAGSSATMPIFKGGFAAVEAEFVFRLASAIEPVEIEYSDEELVKRVSSLHVGIEIASSPMALINELGPCSVVSDFGNNAGLLVGPAVPSWHSQPLESLVAAVTVDNELVGKASAQSIDGGLLQALRFLIASCARRGLTLPRGTLVSTGAVTGIHEVQLDSKACVDFESLGSFDVAFEPMRPNATP